MKTPLCFSAFLLGAILIVACKVPADHAPASLQPDTFRDFTVSVEMSSQGLWARAFEIRVDQTGTGEFKGKYGAHEFSSVPLGIQPSRVDDIRAAIVASQFFTLPHEYPSDSIIDAGVTCITIAIPLGSRSVCIQSGSASSRRPDAKLILDLEDAIHRAVDSAPLLERYCAWTRLPSGSSAVPPSN